MERIEHYLLPFTIFFGTLLAARAIRFILRRTIFLSDAAHSKYLPELDKYCMPVLYLGAIYATYRSASVGDHLEKIADYAFKIAAIVLSIRMITRAIVNTFTSYLENESLTQTRFKQARGIVIIINLILWTIGLIFLFDNLGFNVTAVLTGLGVGGIAIALAAQTILGDLFNYFVIFFDQPFELGDFIIVDDKLGTVEYIGLKSTRLRSLQGEQIIFSNTNLTNARVHNYKRMNERRIPFKLGVVYDTSVEKLEAIPPMIKSIIESLPDTRFDRAHFVSFGDYSLNIEVVYYMLTSDYNIYMDRQQQINLMICEKFRQNQIKFAFPTYSVDFRAQEFATSTQNGQHRN